MDHGDVSKIVVPNPLEIKAQNSSSVEAVRTTFINSRDQQPSNPKDTINDRLDDSEEAAQAARDEPD